ncbi:hypothetical protein J6590_005205 [Homalodisca vitripennis]|nr:hypothetical protein J6590_005205 [Homalodisca vitripennis]
MKALPTVTRNTASINFRLFRANYDSNVTQFTAQQARVELDVGFTTAELGRRPTQQIRVDVAGAPCKHRGHRSVELVSVHKRTDAPCDPNLYATRPVPSIAKWKNVLCVSARSNRARPPVWCCLPSASPRHNGQLTDTTSELPHFPWFPPASRHRGNY